MELINKTRNYLEDVVLEMKKVSWPTWDELKNSTIVVTVAVLLITIFIWAVDFILSTVIKQIIKL